jgi:hypothetical protein
MQKSLEELIDEGCYELAAYRLVYGVAKALVEEDGRKGNGRQRRRVTASDEVVRSLEGGERVGKPQE